jgi:hypothetical protein
VLGVLLLELELLLDTLEELLELLLELLDVTLDELLLDTLDELDLDELELDENTQVGQMSVMSHPESPNAKIKLNKNFLFIITPLVC